jgi:chromosome segregation ATPase
VDGVPSHEGIQDDVDAAPFRESNETLVETASYLVDLDKYARRLKDESCTLFGQIRDATVDARQYQPHCAQLEREHSVLHYRVRQLEQSLDRATAVLLQFERERVDTHEEMLHIKEDLCRLTACQNRLKDSFSARTTCSWYVLTCSAVSGSWWRSWRRVGRGTSPTSRGSHARPST